MDTKLLIITSVLLAALSFIVAGLMSAEIENDDKIERFEIMKIGNSILSMIKPKTVGGLLVFFISLPATIFVMLGFCTGVFIFKVFKGIISIRIR